MVDALVGVGPPGEGARKKVRGLALLQVPAVFPAEVTSGLCSLVRAGELAAFLARTAALECLEARTQEYPFGPFLQRIWALRENLTAYDAWYVALAERLDEPLLTADRRLARTPGLRCEVVVTFGSR